MESPLLKYAPIILFVYKRLNTLKKTIHSLQNNFLAIESDLYIFSEGPRDIMEHFAIEEIRIYLKSIKGFKSVTIIESEENKGLATSVIQGVNQIFSSYKEVVVLEDDCITSSNFLNFMNICLNKYSTNKKVFSVSGYSLDLKKPKNYDLDAYFLNRGWSWGWATWKDRWDKVDWQISDYLEFKKDHELRQSFAKGGSNLNAMLDNQMTKKIDSWAIRWWYNQFKFKGLTAYPILTKVKNIGFDNEATHTLGYSKRYISEIDNSNQTDFNLPEKVAINLFCQSQFLKKTNILARIIYKIEKSINRLLLRNLYKSSRFLH